MLPAVKPTPKAYFGTYTDDDLEALSALPRSASRLWFKIRLKGPANRPVYINETAIADELKMHVKTVEIGLRQLEKAGLLSAPLKGNKNWRILYHSKRNETAPAESETTPARNETAPNWSETAPKLAANDRPQTQEKSAIAPTGSEIPTKIINKETYKETQQRETEADAIQAAKTDVVVFSKNVDQGKKREVVKRLLSVGVSDVVAYQLAKSYPLDGIEQQLEWLLYRKADNKAALLVKAVKENFSAPLAIAKAAEQKADEEKRTAQKRDQVLTNVKMQIAERLKAPVVRASGEVYAFMNACRSAGRPVPFADDEIPVKIQNAAAAIAERDAKQEAENRRALELVGLCYDDVLESVQ